jgi:hypothetical protein
MPHNAVMQVQDMVRFRSHSTPAMKERFQGIVQTVWSDAGSFLDRDYAGKATGKNPENNPWNTFKAMFDELDKLKGAEAK